MHDVCLVLESTYPKVTGGVSQWVHDLVGGLPEVDFAVAHLGAGAGGADAYRPPANVGPVNYLESDPERGDAASSHDGRLPEARIYHALSTGLASAVAARAASETGGTFGLTEHGLAWREARFGISGCKTPKGSAPAEVRRGDVAKDAAMLEAAARVAYADAAWVATVCGKNADLQRGLGLREHRSHVIPNALRADEAPTGRNRREATKAPLVGLVGRVVPIKDIATFLRSCRLVADAIPEAEFRVIGPLDHVPAYAERCLELAEDLDLGDRLRFTGETDPGRWYHRLDVAVLTSLSEAQPLALIEAMAAGVPVVSSAVGGCEELLRGGEEEAAGLLTPVADPAATATAVLSLLRSPERRWRLSAAGQQRARDAHDPERFVAAYRALYDISA